MPRSPTRATRPSWRSSTSSPPRQSRVRPPRFRGGRTFSCDHSGHRLVCTLSLPSFGPHRLDSVGWAASARSKCRTRRDGCAVERLTRHTRHRYSCISCRIGLGVRGMRAVADAGNSLLLRRSDSDTASASTRAMRVLLLRKAGVTQSPRDAHRQSCERRRRNANLFGM